MHVNPSPWRSKRIRYGAISNLFPLTVLFVLFQWWRNENTGSSSQSNGAAIDASVSDNELGDVLTSALLTPQPPLFLQQTVKPTATANVSEFSVNQGRLRAVDKYWKCYPSLKHHSFTYCKCASLWAPNPYCWQGGRQHQAAPAMSQHHQMQPQTEFSQLKLQRTDGKSESGLWFNCSLHCQRKIILWAQRPTTTLSSQWYNTHTHTHTHAHTYGVPSVSK